METSKSEIFDTIELLGDFLVEKVKGRKVFILTDENVSNDCLPLILPRLNNVCEPEVIELEPGESSKKLDICGHIWTHLLECQAAKDDIMLNIGGGVITDLGGFIAATYKRGIPFIHIPTTLMGMIDAAHGGKNGLDHDEVKNAIGTFSTPQSVLVCPEFLQTLPQEELLSGFAEMLKHALIVDSSHWRDLTIMKVISVENITPHIRASIAIKEKIVANDFYEKAERKLLNFGHTLGHAIESHHILKKKPISHGMAVAIGMTVETFIAFELGLTNEASRNEITLGINKYFDLKLNTLPAYDHLAFFLKNDKKNLQGKFMLSLPVIPGEVKFNVEVSQEMVEKAYNKFLISLA